MLLKKSKNVSDLYQFKRTTFANYEREVKLFKKRKGSLCSISVLIKGLRLLAAKAKLFALVVERRSSKK